MFVDEECGDCGDGCPIERAEEGIREWQAGERDDGEEMAEGGESE